MEGQQPVGAETRDSVCGLMDALSARHELRIA